MNDIYNELDRISYYIWFYSNNPSVLIELCKASKKQLLSPNCDKNFRILLKRRLLDLNFSEEVVEEGLEVYGIFWKERYMKEAFYISYRGNINYESFTQEEKKSLMKEWIKGRQEEYYQQHKYYMDKCFPCNPAAEATEKDIAYANIQLERIRSKKGA